MLKTEYEGREAEVLAGLTGEAGLGVDEHTLGQLGDGWAEYLPSLENFPYARYGIVVPPPESEAANSSDDKDAAYRAAVEKVRLSAATMRFVQDWEYRKG